MMQREVAAIVLCILAQAASAQCVATPIASAADVNAAVPASETVRAPGTAIAAVKKPAHGELIKTAAAGTRDDEAPPAMTARAHPNGQQDHPRRGGTAMLLAALALMSGIALRRFGAPHA
jgi:hypothetical protein